MQIRSLYLRSGCRLLLVLLALLFLFFLIRSTLYPFLAPNQPPYRGWMIIEGWIEDAALIQAISLYTNGDYEGIYTTGVPLDVGSPLLTYHTYAEMTTARLIALGIPPDEIRTVSATYTQRDRTYRAALALRDALHADGMSEGDLHLISVGPHSRRSRLLFRTALGDRFSIGISALPDSSYPSEKWYQYSKGVRAVLAESIAYLYALWSPRS